MLYKDMNTLRKRTMHLKRQISLAQWILHVLCLKMPLIILYKFVENVDSQFIREKQGIF